MRKRFNAFWRVAVVLLVVASIASVAIPSGTTQAAATRAQMPNTYMDPIPERINATYVVTQPWLTGTTLEGATGPGYAVVGVEVQIKRAYDGWCWNNSSTQWVADPDVWNYIAVVGLETWTSDQWRWVFNGSWTAANFHAGWSYTVKVRAKDADGYVDGTPATDAFMYDNEIGDVSFTTSFPARIYSLTEIKGTAYDRCGDQPGVMQQIRIAISDNNDSVWWNGFFWQPDPVWIRAQGTSSWSISTTTNPPLPEWQHNVNYSVWVQSSDNADNRDFAPGTLAGAGQTFLYRKKLDTAGSCYLDLLPTYANSNPALGSYWRFMDPAVGFRGTAKALPLQNIVLVAVEIKDVTSNVYWDNVSGAWNGSVTWACCANNSSPAYDSLSGQWDWNVFVPVALTWQQGHTYQVRAQATDNSGTPKTYLSGTDSFIYDNILPAPSNIDAFYDPLEVYNAWPSLTGNCEDDSQGKMAAEIVRINRSSDGLWWNGVSWGGAEWNSGDAAGEWDWIYAAGSFGQTRVLWQVTGTTAYPLPLLDNDEVYTITAMSFDVAGNEETTATKDFTFRMDLSGWVAPNVTAVPTNTSAPTAVPTNTSTTVPTSPPGGTKTPTATPPHVATATQTTVPAGFSGSGTIGSGGGTVTAKDGSGDTSVTATFEAGAFGSNTAVTVSGSGNCNAVGTAPSGYSKGTSCFSITPAGDLDANVEICVYYTSADQSAAGGDPDNLVLAYKDGSTWVILDTTADGDTICAETDQIGTFAVLGKAAAEGGGWEWWYYLLIGLGALLIIAIIVLILVRPKGEGEGAAEEGYEEEEEI